MISASAAGSITGIPSQNLDSFWVIVLIQTLSQLQVDYVQCYFNPTEIRVHCTIFSRLQKHTHILYKFSTIKIEEFQIILDNKQHCKYYLEFTPSLP